MSFGSCLSTYLGPRTALRKHAGWLEETLPILIEDDEGRLIAASRSARSLLGLEHRELRGRAVRELEEFGVHVRRAPQRFEPTDDWQRWLIRSERTGQAFELWWRAHEGGYRVAVLLPERTLAKHGTAATEGSVPPHLSHELRTPLQGILGLCELLESAELSEEAREYVDLIDASARTLLGIVNEVLFFNALRHGKYEYNLDRFDPHRVVLDVCRSVCTNAFLKDVDLLVDVEPGFPAAIVTDRGAFWHVVFNLVGNAVKFTDQGYVLVRLSYDRLADAVEVAVRDTGPGIRQEERERIFRPFEQGSTGTGRKHLGSGLGLSIVKQLVEGLNGSVTVESEPGRGATFRFLLPSVQGSKPRREPSLQGRTCLVAGFRAGLQTVLAERLAAAGARVGTLQSMAALPAQALDVVADREGLLGFVRWYRAADVRPAAVRLFLLKYPGQAVPSTEPLEPPQVLNMPVSTLRVLHALAGQDASAEEPASPERLEATRPGKTVLVVDDAAITRRLVQRLLEKAGYRVLAAGGGPEALQVVTSRPVDVIVLDLCMPDMDGLTVIDIIRNLPGCPNRKTPIIAVSADGSAPLREAAWSRGVSYFLEKPIRGTQLLQTIEAALDGKPLPAEVDATEYLGALI